VGAAPATIGYTVAKHGGVFRPEQWAVSKARLSIDERVEIALGLRDGLSFTVIALRL